MDKPSERSSHDHEIPKGGGIGILAAFVFACIVLSVSKSFWISTAFISLFSFFGDRFDISPKIRLVFQLGASAVLLMGFFIVKEISPLAYLLFIPLSVFVVGTANFYNFMDGINGIAGLTGAVAFGFLAFYGGSSGADFSHVALSTCLSVSCVGFLPFNIPNARVFMGDVGSILLGFFFAGTVVCLSKSFLDFLCLSALLFPFYADELVTLAARIKDRDNLTKPHRRHIFQFLANEKGISHWKVSVGYALAQVLVAVTVMALRAYGLMPVLGGLLVYFLSVVIVGYIVRKQLKRPIH